jgi:tetratricopeptide (TPR) repeat protein
MVAIAASGQTEQSDDLLGPCDIADLHNGVNAEWFNKNYVEYIPNTSVVEQLKTIDIHNCSVSIFFATWCGDSRREVPRFIKLLDAMGFPNKAITMIALSDKDSIYKQSPVRHEELGQNIYRVPTFIIYDKDKELNRIIEYPALSLEYDLLAIFKKIEYQPNYPSYIEISKYIDNGLLIDDNVNYRGLANKLRNLVHSVRDLNTCAYVLSQQSGNDAIKAAIKLYKINSALYPDIWWVYSNLAQALHNTGDYTQAAQSIKRAIELNKDSENVKSLFELYDSIQKNIK